MNLIKAVDYIKTINAKDFLIKHYGYQFKKQNNTYVSVCKFHDDSKPSLTYYENTNTLTCFVCGTVRGAGLIEFIAKEIRVVKYTDKQVKGDLFKDIVRLICSMEGIRVEDKKESPEVIKLRENTAKYQERYVSNLFKNEAALNYLKEERKISEETIKTFCLGFTDSQEFKFRSDFVNENGNYSGISSRITFPIFERNLYNARVAGFGYRSIDPNCKKEYRYLNDKENAIFQKGDLLYGLQQAINYIKKTNQIIVVEGYMDVISLHSAGLKNVVGLLNNNITTSQADLISTLSKNCLLFLDNDNAGINGAKKAIIELVKRGVGVRVCNYTTGKDPGDLCLECEGDRNKIVSKISASCKHGIKYLLDNSLDLYDNEMLRIRGNAISSCYDVLEVMADGPDKINMESFIKQRLNL